MAYYTQEHGDTHHWLNPGTDEFPACFMMAPFASRIQGGRFSYTGRRVSLKANVIGEPNPIHGSAWQAVWQVQLIRSASAQLFYAYLGDADWPWPFELTFRVVLSEYALKLTLELRNTSDEVMPVGLGLHPFFTSTPGASISFDASKRWLLDEGGIPQQPFLQTDSGRQNLVVQHESVDAAYSGWRSTAEVYWPEWQYKLVLTSNAQHLVVYTPQDSNYFCVEPVTNVPNGFNLPSTQLPVECYQTVLPGSVNTLTTSILLQPLIS